MYFNFMLLCIIFFAAMQCKANNPGEGIFDRKRCEMKCNGEPHTLCPQASSKANSSCLLTKSAISDGQRKEMQHMLIIGHNGLRNRIAERMRVANMVEMVWHHELVLMAKNYIDMCKPYETDECALLPQSVSGNGNSDRMYHDVAQNRYLQKEIHYPNLLIENALRAWYLERDAMNAPTYEFNFILQTYIGYIFSENNFTHLASPLTTHFGCAFDKITLGYLLICNYHPYKRLENFKVDYLHGEPGSLCPVSRPLKNVRESMTNLCIGVERNPAPLQMKSILAMISTAAIAHGYLCLNSMIRNKCFF